MPKGRGGPGRGQGRKKNQSDAQSTKVGKGFATEVLGRIHELDLHVIGKNGKATSQKIKTASDYALENLRARDGASKAFFLDLLLWALGKPVQPVEQRGKVLNTVNVTIRRVGAKS